MVVANGGVLFSVFGLAIAFSLLLAGCASQAPQATPTPTVAATATPTAVPTATPTAVATATPTPSASESPSPSAPAQNYDTPDNVVQAYLTALAAKDYAGAYALVSSDFKNEDVDAASLELFSKRVAEEFPPGFSFSNVRLASDNLREVLVTLSRPGALTVPDYGIIAEKDKDGKMMVRVAFPTKGVYYNGNTTLAYRIPELSRFFEMAVNDYFHQFDSSLNKTPFSFSLYDFANKIYYGKKTIKVGGTVDSRGSDSTFEITYGPSDFVAGWEIFSDLADGRQYTYKYRGSAFTGGFGALQCYASKAYRSTFSITIDSALVQKSAMPDEPFRPIFEFLKKACPK